MAEIDIRRLDFNLLLVFLELMRHRQATAAAQRLNLTQSTVSHALARLREIFQDELFLRRPNGLTPTQRAVELEPMVRDIVEAARAALAPERAFDPSRATGLVRIGASDHVGALIGPPLLRRLREAAPGLVLSLRPFIRGQATDALAAGELDLALGLFWRLPPNLNASPLYEESYDVIARPDHPAIRDRAITLDDYVAAEHVLLSYDGEPVGIVDRALAARGLARRVVCTVPVAFAAFAAVAGGGLVATVPRRLARAFAAGFGLVAVEPPMAIRPFCVSLVWHERTASSRMRAWVAQEIAACLA